MGDDRQMKPKSNDDLRLFLHLENQFWSLIQQSVVLEGWVKRIQSNLVSPSMIADLFCWLMASTLVDGVLRSVPIGLRFGPEALPIIFHSLVDCWVVTIDPFVTNGVECTPHV